MWQTNMQPNQDQVMTLVRSALVIIGTVLVMLGKTSDGNWQIISGSIMAIVPIVWGLFDRTQASTVAKVAAMKGTEVSRSGDTIKITDPNLAYAAAVNATTVTGKPI